MLLRMDDWHFLYGKAILIEYSFEDGLPNHSRMLKEPRGTSLLNCLSSRAPRSPRLRSRRRFTVHAQELPLLYVRPHTSPQHGGRCLEPMSTSPDLLFPTFSDDNFIPNRGRARICALLNTAYNLLFALRSSNSSWWTREPACFSASKASRASPFFVPNGLAHEC